MAKTPQASAISLMRLVAQYPYTVQHKSDHVVPLIALERDGFIYKKNDGWWLTDKGRGHVEQYYKRENEKLRRSLGRYGS